MSLSGQHPPAPAQEVSASYCTPGFEWLACRISPQLFLGAECPQVVQGSEKAHIGGTGEGGRIHLVAAG